MYLWCKSVSLDKFYLVIYFGFTEEVYEVEETAQDATVCVELSEAQEAIQSPVWLGLTTEDETALGI